MTSGRALGEQVNEESLCFYNIFDDSSNTVPRFLNVGESGDVGFVKFRLLETVGKGYG